MYRGLANDAHRILLTARPLPLGITPDNVTSSCLQLDQISTLLELMISTAVVPSSSIGAPDFPLPTNIWLGLMTGVGRPHATCPLLLVDDSYSSCRWAMRCGRNAMI